MTCELYLTIVDRDLVEAQFLIGQLWQQVVDQELERLGKTYRAVRR